MIDPLATDAVAEITAFTAGEGAAAVLDFVGSDSTLEIATGAVGRQGIVVLVGLAGGAVPFSFFSMATEAQLTTSDWGNCNELAEVIALAEQGRLQGRIERHALGAINTVFERLERGQIDGRAVLVP